MAISSPHVDQDLIKYDLNILSTHPPPCYALLRYDLLPPAHQFSFPVINFSFHLCCTGIVVHWTTAAGLELNPTMKGKATLSLWKGSSLPLQKLTLHGTRWTPAWASHTKQCHLEHPGGKPQVCSLTWDQNLCLLINKLFCWSMGAVSN